MPTSSEFEVVEQIYAAMERSDHRRLRGLLSPALRWRQAAKGVPAAGQQNVGSQELLDRVVTPLEDDWEQFTEVVEELTGGGGLVVATGTYRGTHRNGGKLIAEFCHLWEVWEGRAVSFRQYTDTAAFERLQSRQPVWAGIS